MKATGSDPRARFVLRFRGEGTVQVDWVSLFPPTYKGRSNGLRPDLAKYLERGDGYLRQGRSADAANESDTVKTEIWLGGRDSNPDYTVQSRVSYH